VKCTFHERSRIFTRDKISSRQRGCYIRARTATVQLKKSLVMGLKGLEAKMN
jgi:hypothetical protein